MNNIKNSCEYMKQQINTKYNKDTIKEVKNFLNKKENIPSSQLTLKYTKDDFKDDKSFINL